MASFVGKENRSACLICGRPANPEWRDGEFRGHVCKQSVLDAIDGAHCRDPDEPCPLADSMNRPYGERLADGFRMMSDDEPD